MVTKLEAITDAGDSVLCGCKWLLSWKKADDKGVRDSSINDKDFSSDGIKGGVSNKSTMLFKETGNRETGILETVLFNEGNCLLSWSFTDLIENEELEDSEWVKEGRRLCWPSFLSEIMIFCGATENDLERIDNEREAQLRRVAGFGLLTTVVSKLFVFIREVDSQVVIILTISSLAVSVKTGSNANSMAGTASSKSEINSFGMSGNILFPLTLPCRSLLRVELVFERVKNMF